MSSQKLKKMETVRLNKRIRGGSLVKVVLKNKCDNISFAREKLLPLSQADEIDRAVTHLP